MQTHVPSISAFPRMAYSLSEVEAMVSISRATLYRMIAAGTLRSVKFGGRKGRRLVPREELERLLHVPAEHEARSNT